ncbi:MAG: hypothetical protein P0119_22785 [Nitrospira sp.]|nr:hypothetical protein [Nitrospira sp.]
MPNELFTILAAGPRSFPPDGVPSRRVLLVWWRNNRGKPRGFSVHQQYWPLPAEDPMDKSPYLTNGTYFTPGGLDLGPAEQEADVQVCYGHALAKFLALLADDSANGLATWCNAWLRELGQQE